MFRRALLILLGLVAVVGSGFAGVWFARSPGRWRTHGPLTLRAVVGADASVVKTEVDGRIRLVTVREGDEVKQGQLVAWLDAPLLRESVRAAEEAVRDAQRELEAFRSGRRGGPREDLARAEAAAAAAQRALENAAQMSRQAPVLMERLAAARAAKEEADVQLAAAEAALTQPDEGNGGGALVSGDGGQPVVGTSNTQALAAVAEARARKEAAEEELAEAQRLNRRAEEATRRLPELREKALRAASAAREARARVESAPPEETDRSAEDRLREAVRQAQVYAARTRAQLKAAVVVSPASGLVENVVVTAGQELSAGDAIATIRCLDPVWAEVTLPADAVNRVRRGQKATVQSLSTPPVTVEGEVSYLSPRSTETDSPWVVRVSFENSGNRMLPGTDVEVTLK